MAPPVFKTGLAGNTLAGRFDSFPPPPLCRAWPFVARTSKRVLFGRNWPTNVFGTGHARHPERSEATVLGVKVASTPLADSLRSA